MEKDGEDLQVKPEVQTAHPLPGRDLNASYSSHTSSGPLSSPRSESGYSFWEQNGFLSSRCETVSSTDLDSSSRSARKKSRSRESLASDVTSASSKSKRKRRNRLVDIEEIHIEFDPQKEFLWEMRRKYERKKKQESTEKLAETVADTHEEKPTNSDHPPSSESSNMVTESTMVDTHGESHDVTAIKVSKSEGGASSMTTNKPNNTASSSDITDVIMKNESQSHVMFLVENGAKNDRTKDVSPEKTPRLEDVPLIRDSSVVKDPVVRLDSSESFHLEDVICDGQIEVLVLHRLPGEKLGMGLSIESVGGDNDPVKGVFIETVTPSGAADRATGGTNGFCVGDEILEVNGTPLIEVTYSETVTFFREMPLRVIFMVRRKKELEPDSSSIGDHTEATSSISGSHHSPSDDGSFLDAIPDGFSFVKVRLMKELDENLGLSIVPSYGSTSQYYQVSVIFSILLSLTVHFIRVQLSFSRPTGLFSIFLCMSITLYLYCSIWTGEF